MYNKKIDFLNKPVYFQFIFIILLIFSIINCLYFKNEELYFLYILLAIILGIGFYNSPAWFLVLATTFLVICRFFLLMETTYNLFTFITFLLTYLIIMFITVSMMKHVQHVKNANLELIKALVNALDSRDKYTLHHSENVAKYGLIIAKKMKLPRSQCDVIFTGGLLHDIGKIGLPENILLKPGKLSTEEFELVKTHPVIGYKIIKHVSNFYGNGVLDIVLYHHERFDGNGYPKGLKGNEIPLFARIIAVADAFDAMTSKRVYRNDLDLKFTLDEIRKNKGTQFDPEITDVFLGLFESEKEFTFTGKAPLE